MPAQFVVPPRRLCDRELIDRVRHLAGHERRATACLIAHLAELDQRGLHVAEGCASLFVYCTEVLHLSEGAAYNRIEAARAARKFPLILERLADGSVHVTGVRMLAQYLTEENHRDLLNEATHRSKAGIEEIIARIRPRDPVPSRVRKVPVRTAAADAADDLAALPALDFAGSVIGEPGGTDTPSHRPGSSSVVAQGDLDRAAGCASGDVAARDGHPSTRRHQRASTSALAPDMYRVQFTADAETYKLLCQAKELLKHQIPDGDAGAVIGLALKVLVEKVSRQKLGAAKKPRQREGRAASSASRHIPAHVRREVWTRDQGRCAFVARDGRRCGERGRLEFHHVKPFACGGLSATSNIQLRCRVHNQHESELHFGSRVRQARGGLFLERVGKCDRSGSGPDARPAGPAP